MTMQTFKMNDLSDWLPVEPMSALPFKAQAARRLRLKVLANAPTSVFVARDETMKDRRLIAFGVGLLDLQVVVDFDGWVGFQADPDALIEVQFAERDQTIAKSDDVVFTSVMPSGRRNTSEDRIAMFVKMNERRRNAIFAQELQRMRQAVRQDHNRQAAPAEPEPVIEPETPQNEGNADVQPPKDASAS